MILKTYVLVLIGCSFYEGSSGEQITMHNKHFKIGVVPRPPDMVVITKNKNGQDIVGGLMGKVLKYLEKARNCSFKVVIPDDGLWGNCFGRYNCTGMIGLVSRNEVDFAVGNKMTLYAMQIRSDIKMIFSS